MIGTRFVEPGTIVKINTSELVAREERTNFDDSLRFSQSFQDRDMSYITLACTTRTPLTSRAR